MQLRIVVTCLLLNACTAEIDGDMKAGDNLADEMTLADDDSGTDPGGELRARVCADGATVKGIDVSKWQETINWTSVKNAGIGFAFIRLSDGANYKDAKFATNWAGAKAAGIIRGAYQFFRPSQNVTTQADMMIAAIGTYQPGDLPPVIDVEDAAGLAPSTVANRVRQWVDRVQAALGVQPIVYTGKYFWRDEVGSPSSFAPNALWIAQYTSLCPDLPAPWSKWTFWQYTDKGSVAGVPGPVDTDRFNGTMAQLQAFAHATPLAPIAFQWQRNTNGSYTFTASPPPGVAKLEVRVEDYLIGAGASFNYTFNVATANRVIEVRGTSASGAVVALGNGIIDSIAGSAVFVRQTGEHEYEVGLERAPATWATVEVSADGTLLTDLDTNTQRSTRRAVRYKFSGLGNRALTIVARDANGTVVDTRTRTLAVR